MVADVEPDRQNYPNLPHPPFVTNIRQGLRGGWGDLRIEGYIAGQKVMTKILSGKGADQQLHIEPDDVELIGDGIDATRVVLRVTDEFGGSRPFANSAIVLTIDGPGEIIGENPFSLFGGRGRGVDQNKRSSGHDPAQCQNIHRSAPRRLKFV